MKANKFYNKGILDRRTETKKDTSITFKKQRRKDVTMYSQKLMWSRNIQRTHTVNISGRQLFIISLQFIWQQMQEAIISNATIFSTEFV